MAVGKVGKVMTLGVTTMNPLLNDNDNDTCNIYKDFRKNSKGSFIVGYEGIPQNLVLNLCGVLLLVLVFSVLRKKAWNYGRIALINDIKWTNMFYGSSEEGIGIVVGEANRPRTTADGPAVHSRHLMHSFRDDHHHHRPDNIIRDTGYFSWIKITYKLTDQQFLAKSGPDAVQYLSYQRHLIFLAAIVTLACLVIVLPLNLQGTKDYNVVPDITIFEQSTIFNLGSDSKLLWIHEMLALTFLCLSIVVMRHFSRSVQFVEEDTTIRRTVLISGITKTHCNDGRVRGHFESLHPECRIEEINFVYDVSKLVECESEKAGVVSSRKYWEEIILNSGKRPTMRPYTCGHICCCCCCFLRSTDALNYYMDLEHRLRKQSALERKRALAKPLGMAFVTFSSVTMAETAVNEYRLTARLLKQTPISKYSRRLKTSGWIVSFAPLPDDLYWENLSLGYKAWFFKAILVNVTLVLIVCFYSTPVFLLNVLNAYLAVDYRKGAQHSPETSHTLQGVLLDTVPTFLLWIAAVTLPGLVSLSDHFVGFWTKTSENRSKMIKTFTFLLFMVIILPSLGLTSASTFFQDSEIRWECIFSPSNGSFFVNYLITSCFLGTMSELLRIPELFVYTFKLCFAKSAADIGAIRKSVLFDFQLGSQYAWMMLIFAIFLLFSLITPVITLFGFIYLLFKHYVDRYNIYFAYAPCKVDKEVHGTAINFVVVCSFLQQMILVAYTSSSNMFDEKADVHDDFHHQVGPQMNRPLRAFTILGFCVTSALFIGQVFFNMCANFSPILYNRLNSNSGDLSSNPSSTEAGRTASEISSGSDMITLVPAPNLASSSKTSSEFFAHDTLPEVGKLSEAILQASASEGEISPSHFNNNLHPAETQTAELNRKRRLERAAKQKTQEERERDIDREIMENHYRPGIDKPYGQYFPTVLRLDYDEDSTLAFNHLYHKTSSITRNNGHRRDSNLSTKEDLILLQHNRGDDCPPVIVIST